MTTVLSPSTNAHADAIARIHAEEAHHLLTEAFNRFITLIESLHAEEWSRPTACTAWDVHDMVAHQAGGYASGTSYREMFRQYSQQPKKGQLPEDVVNELQVGERKGKSHAELIAELKRVGPPAIQNWAYGFRAIKWVGIPHPVAGFLSIRHLMWVIHSRDTWMHRLDICRATGRPFEQTPAHDGRIVELVVRDTAKKLTGKLNGQALTLNLRGIAGGKWKIGNGDLVAEMDMDALDFNIFVSGRFSFEEGMMRANISGNHILVENAFRDSLVLF